MDNTTFFAGVALKAMIEWQHKHSERTTTDDLDKVTKAAWEWAHAMVRNGPGPVFTPRQVLDQMRPREPLEPLERHIKE